MVKISIRIAHSLKSCQDKPMVAWLRIIVSCFSLALCIMFSTLWMRSYFYRDLAIRQTGFTLLRLNNSQGVIRGEFYRSKSRIDMCTSTVYQFRSRDAPRGGGGKIKGFLGFYIWNPSDSSWRGNQFIEFSFPPWPFVLLTAPAALLVRPTPRWRFGLRDLMMLITFLGIMLGVITSLINASGLAI